MQKIVNELCLDCPHWESVNIRSTSVDKWIWLAATINDYKLTKSHYQVVARIQSLLVHAGLITDHESVESLRRVRG